MPRRAQRQLIGRWQSRIAAYGHDASWHGVYETVASHIRTPVRTGLRVGERRAPRVRGDEWRLSPTDPIRTQTVEQLLSALPVGVQLLVAANTPAVAEAQQKLAGRTTIVTWRDRSDDVRLREAVTDLLT